MSRPKRIASAASKAISDSLRTYCPLDASFLRASISSKGKSYTHIQQDKQVNTTVPYILIIIRERFVQKELGGSASDFYDLFFASTQFLEHTFVRDKRFY